MSSHLWGKKMMNRIRSINVCFFSFLLLTVFILDGGTLLADPTSQALNIPLRTWTYYLLPTSMANGPAQQGSGVKHMRMFYNGASHQMVLAGGDTNNQYISDDGNNMVWSKDLSTVVSTPNWTLLAPWCYNTGQIQPARPDTVGWAYDSKRNVGVMMPGFYFGTQGSYSNCQSFTGQSPTETNDSVTFDFSTNTWSAATYPPPNKGYGGDEGSCFSVYDPVTDSVIRFRDACCVEVLHRATNTWSYYSQPYSTNRAQLAIDVVGRNVYGIGTVGMHLLRWNIDTHTFSDLGRMPASWIGPDNPTGVEFETYLVFDSVNRVLISPDPPNHYGQIRGMAFYHVDTGKWDPYEPVTGKIDGYCVEGNVFGYDPANNVMIAYGGHGGTCGSPYVYWLYRYGNGSGSDTTPPSAPKNPRITN